MKNKNKKKSKFYLWCERNKNNFWMKTLLTSIAWISLIILPLLIIVTSMLVLPLIFSTKTAAILTLIILFISPLLAILSNAIFTNWVNQLYQNNKPCLNNRINKDILLPVDKTLTPEQAISDYQSLQRFKQRNKKIDKFLNKNYIKIFIWILFLGLIALLNTGWILLVIYFHPNQKWVETIVWIGLGIPAMFFSICLLGIFTFVLPDLISFKKPNNVKNIALRQEVTNYE